MPINKLFVEGSLDVQVLYPVLQGSPALKLGGPKYGLRTRALTDRRENKILAGYLRDRDFDFDPPVDMSTPTIDSEESGTPFGWRWARHEIENYLIDPALVQEATGWRLVEFADLIRRVAGMIRFYEAARWTVGVVRRDLPPNYQLTTRLPGMNEIELPASLDESSVFTWASDSINRHRVRIVAKTDEAGVQASFQAFSARFDEAFLLDTSRILLWFSGKDLLAGMSDWIHAKGMGNSGAFRATVRDWIIANPIRAVELLPEWDKLLRFLR